MNMVQILFSHTWNKLQFLIKVYNIIFYKSFALSDTSEGAYCVRTVASEWRTFAYKELYRALCPFGEFSNSLTLTIYYIASHWGDFYFCTSSAGLHGFILLLLPSVITQCCGVFVAVGRTAKDVTYRSYFDETFVGGIN